MSGKNPVPNEQAYEGVRAVNPPNVVASPTQNPGNNQKRVQIGDIQVNESTNTAFMLTSAVAGTQTWTALGSGTTGAIVTLTGGSGGAISPVAGNIILAGTANQITTAGSGHTITFSVPSTFIAPGSIASTTTITAATGLTVSAGGAAITGNSTITGSLTASTTLTATLGAITATNGNLVLGTAGNKLSIATGSNASIGTSVAMTAGSVTVSTTAVTASSKIFLTANTPGGTAGTLSAPTASISAGTSFVINSSNAADTATVNWLIVN